MQSLQTCLNVMQGKHLKLSLLKPLYANFHSVRYHLQRSRKYPGPCSRGLTDLSLPVKRYLQMSPKHFHGEFEMQDPKSPEEIVTINVTDKEGKERVVKGKIGDNLLYLCKRYQVEMEGACEASLACTTCHVYVDDNFLNFFPEATETEEDLLDAAPFLKPNSRLGCQLILAKKHDGLKLQLPSATKNFYVDGHKPTSH